jgi:hypothetical protein
MIGADRSTVRYRSTGAGRAAADGDAPGGQSAPGPEFRRRPADRRLFVQDPRGLRRLPPRVPGAGGRRLDRPPPLRAKARYAPRPIATPPPRFGAGLIWATISHSKSKCYVAPVTPLKRTPLKGRVNALATFQKDLGSPRFSATALRAISLVIGPILKRRASRQYRCISNSAA